MKLAQKLVRWFLKNQRPLPWRRHYRPYEVWVSEVMLQQTQVETALPYYRRWMNTFPNILSLARADEKKVLKLWEGLGYYNRARNIHQSAKQIMRQFGGRFPDEIDDMLSLKGLGRYSAGAIASIAFNQPEPIVDGNILRVLSRVYRIGKPIDVRKNTDVFWRLEAKLIPKQQARYFNQGLMELGALLCTVAEPSCPLCPIRGHCGAYKNGDPEDYPVRLRRKKLIRIVASCAVLGHNGRFFIRKRPLGSVMGGLWEFPEWKLAANRTLTCSAVREKTKKILSRTIGVDAGGLKRLGGIKRNYTQHLEQMHVFYLTLPDRISSVDDASWPGTWITEKGFARYPFSSAHAKIARLLFQLILEHRL